MRTSEARVFYEILESENSQQRERERDERRLFTLEWEGAGTFGEQSQTDFGNVNIPNLEASNALN